MLKGVDCNKDGKLKETNELPTKAEYYELLLEVTRLRQVVENMPGNVYWKDEKGTYLGNNKVFRDHVGEIKGRSIYDFLPEVQANDIDQTDLAIMRSGQQFILEENGALIGEPSKTYLTIKKPMYDWNNRLVGLLGVSYDITDSKELKALKEEQKISRKQMSSMKTIASSMSHDLRNILAGIQLGLGRLNHFFTRWLKRDLPEDDISDIKNQEGLVGKLIKRIKDAVTFLEMQLKNITTEKIDTSKFTVLCASECVQKALDDFSWQNDEMRRRVNVTVNKDWMFMGDLTLTKHLLFNLLSNSTHYIKEEGKGSISIVLTEEEFQPVLYFRDTAKGIAKEDAPKVFDRFFTERKNGTGMGLAFCKSVVLAYAGEITCTGQENAFIEFKIKFPRLTQ